MHVKALCRFRPPPKGRLVLWELTNRCNLACLHCCTNSSPQVSDRGDASFEEICRALEQVAGSDISEIYFTGGEPFLRRDLVDIVEVASRQPADIFLATNGTLLEEGNVSRLKATRLKAITISVDGHTADLHNELRRHPTSYDRAVRGIRLCVEAGMPIRVSHMITPSNHQYVPDFCRWVESLGVRLLALNSIIPAGRASSQRQTLLDNHDEDPVVAMIVRMQKELEGTLKIDHSVSEDHSMAPAGCPAGARVAHISANGDISVCSWLYKLDKARFAIGNIKRDELRASLDGWSAPMQGIPKLEEECPIPFVTANKSLAGPARLDIAVRAPGR